MRRAIMPYSDLIVGHKGTHGGDQVTTVRDEFA